jgi:hypothetical protein
MQMLFALSLAMQYSNIKSASDSLLPTIYLATTHNMHFPLKCQCPGAE